MAAGAVKFPQRQLDAAKQRQRDDGSIRATARPARDVLRQRSARLLEVTHRCPRRERRQLEPGDRQTGAGGDRSLGHRPELGQDLVRRAVLASRERPRGVRDAGADRLADRVRALDRARKQLERLTVAPL
jgi:hypothetical protein